MQHIDPKTLETAFVRPGTPTLADLIQRLQEEGAEAGLRPERRRDMVSALRRVAAALGRAPQIVPADPKWLQTRLSRVEPAALQVSDKTWSNVLSNLRATLDHFGIVDRIWRRSDLSPDWQALWSVVLASKDPSLPPALSRFVHFLSGQGIDPDAVRDAHAEAYLAAIEAAEISRSPVTAYRAAVNGWNLAATRLPEWPQQRLMLPSRQTVVCLPLGTFPASFRAAFEDYLTALGRPDPLSLEGRITALRPSSIKLYRQLLHRFASLLVHGGLAASDLVDFEVLTRPEIVRRGLKGMLDRNGGATSKSIETTAQVLRGIGRDHVRRPIEELAVLEDLARRVALGPSKGLTEKNRQRLRPLQNKETLRRLLQLPGQLTAEAKKVGKTKHAALRFEQAVAIDLLLHCPVRVGNLAAVHLERNIQRPRDGRVFLVFGASEVKNRRPIEFELPPRVASLVDEYLADWQPLLCAGTPPWLFARRDGATSMEPGQLAEAVSRRIRKETGLAFNVHLFRHLAAMLWLNANPGSYEVVRRLLGHAELSATLDAYAGFEAGPATRLFGALIEGRRGS